MNLNLIRFFVCVFTCIFVSAVGFAGQGTCPISNIFKCESSYSLGSGQVVSGPSAEAAVVDIEPEPFDPADCEASVLLETAVGTFVADYTVEMNSIRAFIQANGKETSLLNDVEFIQPTVIKVPSPFQGEVKSATFSCSLKK